MYFVEGWKLGRGAVDEVTLVVVVEFLAFTLIVMMVGLTGKIVGGVVGASDGVYILACRNLLSLKMFDFVEVTRISGYLSSVGVE